MCSLQAKNNIILHGDQFKPHIYLSEYGVFVCK